MIKRLVQAMARSVPTDVTLNLLVLLTEGSEVIKSTFSRCKWNKICRNHKDNILLRCVCGHRVRPKFDTDCSSLGCLFFSDGKKEENNASTAWQRKFVRLWASVPCKAQSTRPALWDVHCVGFCLVLCYGAEAVPSYPDITQHCPVLNGRWATAERKVRAGAKKSRMATKEWERYL